MKVTDLALAQCPKWMFPFFSPLKKILAKIKFSTHSVKDNDVLNMKHFYYYEEQRNLSAKFLTQGRGPFQSWSLNELYLHRSKGLFLLLMGKGIGKRPNLLTSLILLGIDSH